uniref:Uncharacterized protein n=1 Tax=viral metagenome TaxID=1070528 RepID=A0A6M3J7N0_9ZZZZ
MSGYRVRSDITLANQEDADYLLANLKKVIGKELKVSQYGEVSSIDYHVCHHDELPPIPCETIEYINLKEEQESPVIDGDVFIAASNAPARDKAKADAVCNGKNDAALLYDVYLSMGRAGHLKVSKGAFYLEQDIPIVHSLEGFILSGQGRSTSFAVLPSSSPRYAFTVGAPGNFCYGSSFRDFSLSLGTPNANGIDLVCGDRISFSGIYSNYGGTVFRCRKDKTDTEVNAISWDNCHLIRYSEHGIHGVNTVTQSMVSNSTISSLYANKGIGVLLEGNPFAVKLQVVVFESNFTSVKMMGGYPKKIESCCFSDTNDNGQLHLHGGESVDSCWFMGSPVAMLAANNAKVRIENINWQSVGEILKLEGALHPKSYVDFLE